VPDVQIFLSYARDDDVQPPDSPKLKGFVTSLYDQLGYEFRNMGPERPTIWRDQSQIERGEQFDGEIAKAIAASSLLVVVLSRNWMNRPYCLQELKSFAEHWRAEGDSGVRSRIVVVGKRHIDPDKRPPLLQGQEGYRFYSLERIGDVEQEHEFFKWGKCQDPRYFDMIEELALYLWHKAECTCVSCPAPSREPIAPSSSVPPNRRTIFLAKPASDMYEAYDRLTKELAGRGYRVVPDVRSAIPEDSSAAHFIDDALLASEVSVHLLGDKLGPSPEDLLPIMKLQLARAAARASTEPGFHRIIWAPKLVNDGAAAASGSTMRDPLEVVKKFDCQLPTDKIEGDTLSRFVDFLFQHLLRTAEKYEKPQQIEGDGRIYLYHSQDDTDYAFAVADALQGRHIETVLPAFEGSQAEINSFHSQNLVECDAVALCWAHASEVWVRAYAHGLRDWRSLGRKEPFAYRGVIAGPPPGNRKKNGKYLFPRSEIDFIIDLVDKDRPFPELLDELVPHATVVPHN
jgi:hypothetical protein